jgi:hypothetical protein
MEEFLESQVLTLSQALTAFDKRTVDFGAMADSAPTADQDSLFALLHTEKAAPSSTSLAAVPQSPTAEIIQELQDVMLLTSFVSVSAMRMLYNSKYKVSPPVITTGAGAADFVQSVANSKNEVLTRAMGGYLSLNTSSARQMSISTTSADLHFEFLNNLFGGFSFPQSTLKELDSVLSSVTDTISNLKLSFSDQSSTLDHMVFFYYFEEVEGLDVKIPKIRLYYLHIDQASWSASVGKSSVQHFEFNMNFLDTIYDMNTQQTAADRDKIKGLLSTWTGQDIDTLNALMSPKAVSDDR